MKTNKPKTYISTKKIIVFPIEEDDAKRKEIYDYLRKSITAQNKAFNLLLSKTASAILDNKSSKTIDDIYNSYSHQKPKTSLGTEKLLSEVLDIAPITEENIASKIKGLEEFLKDKGESEKKFREICDEKEKCYRKFWENPKRIFKEILLDYRTIVLTRKRFMKILQTG